MACIHGWKDDDSVKGVHNRHAVTCVEFRELLMLVIEELGGKLNEAVPGWSADSKYLPELQKLCRDLGTGVPLESVPPGRYESVACTCADGLFCTIHGWKEWSDRVPL